jgi:hypothetical protein
MPIISNEQLAKDLHLSSSEEEENINSAPCQASTSAKAYGYQQGCCSTSNRIEPREAANNIDLGKY